MVYLGMAKLGYSEPEMLAMTPRKFYRMFSEYMEFHGGSRQPNGSFDDLP